MLVLHETGHWLKLKRAEAEAEVQLKFEIGQKNEIGAEPGVSDGDEDEHDENDKNENGESESQVHCKNCEKLFIEMKPTKDLNVNHAILFLLFA